MLALTDWQERVVAHVTGAQAGSATLLVNASHRRERLGMTTALLYACYRAPWASVVFVCGAVPAASGAASDFSALVRSAGGRVSIDARDRVVYQRPGPGDERVIHFVAASRIPKLNRQRSDFSPLCNPASLVILDDAMFYHAGAGDGAEALSLLEALADVKLACRGTLVAVASDTEPPTDIHAWRERYEQPEWTVVDLNNMRPMPPRHDTSVN
jgi:hypothetical protein